MKIYLDLVFFLNFGFDLLLLLTVKIVLKKITSFKRIFAASLVGAGSVLFLFLPLNTFTLFLLKVGTSCLMIRISNHWEGIKTYLIDLAYLYFVSILLGGFLYYLNLEFSYQNTGIIFFHNGFSINYLLLIILSPIVLYFYIKQNQFLRINSQTHYTFSFHYYGKKHIYYAFLDTGNQLYDPYKKRPIVLLYDPNFKLRKNTKMIYVPYETLEHHGVLSCFKVNEVIIDQNIKQKEVLIGISKEPFQIKGVQVILHPDLF